MNEDLLTLLGLYAVTIKVENRAGYGTFGAESGHVQYSAVVTAENSDTKLTGSAWLSGDIAEIIALRERVTAAALADVARQAQALAKAKEYR